eukprot:8750133-Alexandrium_andersonii.AAC.1
MCIRDRCLLAFNNPDAQVIRLRNPQWPTWASGRSALLFVIPLPTEAGGLRAGLEWRSEFVSDSGDHPVDRDATIYTAYFGPWPNVIAGWKARPWSVNIPGVASPDPENPDPLHQGQYNRKTIEVFEASAVEDSSAK